MPACAQAGARAGLIGRQETPCPAYARPALNPLKHAGIRSSRVARAGCATEAASCKPRRVKRHGLGISIRVPGPA